MSQGEGEGGDCEGGGGGEGRKVGGMPVAAAAADTRQ